MAFPPWPYYLSKYVWDEYATTSNSFVPALLKQEGYEVGSKSFQNLVEIAKELGHKPINLQK